MVSKQLCLSSLDTFFMCYFDISPLLWHLRTRGKFSTYRVYFRDNFSVYAAKCCRGLFYICVENSGGLKLIIATTCAKSLFSRPQPLSYYGREMRAIQSCLLQYYDIIEVYVLFCTKLVRPWRPFMLDNTFVTLLVQHPTCRSGRIQLYNSCAQHT